MTYFYIKALHIIFVVTWFSGMFYLGRLFIYNTEANIKIEPAKSILQNQFNIMIKRLLFGITWPSTVLTFIFGLTLLYQNSNYPTWLIIKLIFVFLLTIYQFTLHFLYNQHAKKVFQFSSNQLRIWNELPTLFLVSIVFLVVVKQNLSFIYGLIGIIAFALLLLSAIRIYKFFRMRNEK